MDMLPFEDAGQQSLSLQREHSCCSAGYARQRRPLQKENVKRKPADPVSLFCRSNPGGWRIRIYSPFRSLLRADLFCRDLRAADRLRGRISGADSSRRGKQPRPIDQGGDPMANNPEQRFRTFQPDYSGMNVLEVPYAVLDTYYGGRQTYNLDVITSETVPQNGDTVLFVHGGAFSQPCDKRQAYICLFARQLCALGYTVVSPDYPLFNDVREFEDHPEKHLTAFRTSGAAVNTAFHYIMDHAAEFGVRPGKAALMGGSAGGMASVYAVSREPENYSALVPLWGCPPILPDSMEGFPPTLCVHGTEDRSVPFGLEQPFADALDAAGAAHQLIPLPGQGHTPISQMPLFMPAILKLLEETRGHQ